MKNQNLLGVAIMLLAITGLFLGGCSEDKTTTPNTYSAPDVPATGLATGLDEPTQYGDDYDGIEINQGIDSSLIWDDVYNEDDYTEVDPQDKNDPDIYDPNDPKNPGGGN